MDKIMAENLKNKWIDENPRKPFQHDTVVTWYDLGKMLCVEHNTQKVIFKFLVCEKEYKLYLSFPEIGGVRLYSDFVGFHSARQNKKIEIIKSEKNFIVKSDSKTEVFIKTGDDWRIEILHSGRLVNIIDGRQILLGYDKNNNFTKIKILGKIFKNEVFTGLGERFDSLVRNGRESLLWNYDCIDQLRENATTDRIYSYTNIPLLHSTKGYTLFINSSYAINADIGKKNLNKYYILR